MNSTAPLLELVDGGAMETPAPVALCIVVTDTETHEQQANRLIAQWEENARISKAQRETQSLMYWHDKATRLEAIADSVYALRADFKATIEEIIYGRFVGNDEEGKPIYVGGLVAANNAFKAIENFPPELHDARAWMKDAGRVAYTALKALTTDDAPEEKGTANHATQD